MNCANHAEVLNVAFCIRCGKPLCNECVRHVRGSVYCDICLGDLVEGKPPAGSSGTTGAGGTIGTGPSERRQVVGGTSPGAAFALGLIPGVGAIYNAEYFKAAVHILIFGTLVTIVENS